MSSSDIEALVGALDACATALEHLAGAAGWSGSGGGSLPRLRPQSGGVRIAPSTPGMGLPGGSELTGPAAEEASELAAEFRAAITEVKTGQAGREWMNALASRASQFLEPGLVADVQDATRRCF